MPIVVTYLCDSSGTDVATTLDSHYYKGQGERESAEREFIVLKVTEDEGTADP